MDWTPYGPDAWLLRFADGLGDETFARGRAIATALEQDPPEGLVAFVPSFTSVLLEFRPDALGADPAERLAAIGRRLAAAWAHPTVAAPVVEIPVFYDGPDLERVAAVHGLPVSEVIARHSATEYKVYLIGFSPGFPYLGDLDPLLHTPRLAVPRPRVPAGSVAIGGEHTGIYSVESPGGWNILGRTPVRLFVPEAAEAEGVEVAGGPAAATATADHPVRGPLDPDRRIFRLRAGDRVRFVPLAAWPDAGEGAAR